jgi:hypothetical protein
MPVNVGAIANQILAEATNLGGDTWNKIQKATPLYVKGYVQSLADIAAGVSKGEITKSDAKMFVKNATLMLVMGIANTSHIVLVEVQTFINAVLGILKTAINAALPVPVL